MERQSILRLIVDGGNSKQTIGKLDQSIIKLNRTVVDAREKKRKLTKAFREGKVSQEAYADGVLKLNNTIKKQGTELTRLRRKALGMGKTWSNLSKTLGAGVLRFAGITSGVLLLTKAISGAFTTIKDFDQSLADLAAVMGKNKDEMEALSENAQRLGATTAFTAEQVLKLQKELAKLGFTEQEIVASTQAVINLSVATGTDLARSAEVAGNTLRAFQLDASEMTDVVDIMTKSFSSSALDVEKFAEAMKNVAPIAQTANVDLQTTTALLGTLADVGISGSLAGNQLKRIISELATEGSKLSTSLGGTIKNGEDLQEAFVKLSASGLTLGQAEDFVGKRAKGALLVLAELSSVTAELDEALESAGGTAQAMADTQLDTLSGKTKLLKSAWDGLILSIDNGEGVISDLVGGSLGLLIKLLEDIQGKEITLRNKGVAQASREFEEYRDTISEVNDVINDSSKTFSEQYDAVDQLRIKQEELEQSARVSQRTFESYGGAIENSFDQQDQVQLTKQRLDEYVESQEALIDSGKRADATFEELSAEFNQMKDSYGQNAEASKEQARLLGEEIIKANELVRANKLRLKSDEELRNLVGEGDKLAKDILVERAKEKAKIDLEELERLEKLEDQRERNAQRERERIAEQQAAKLASLNAEEELRRRIEERVEDVGLTGLDAEEEERLVKLETIYEKELKLAEGNFDLQTALRRQFLQDQFDLEDEFAAKREKKAQDEYKKSLDAELKNLQSELDLQVKFAQATFGTEKEKEEAVRDLKLDSFQEQARLLFMSTNALKNASDEQKAFFDDLLGYIEENSVDPDTGQKKSFMSSYFGLDEETSAQLTDAILTFSKSVSDAIFQNEQQQRERKLEQSIKTNDLVFQAEVDRLKAELEAGTITELEFSNRREEILKKQTEAEEKIRKAAFEKDKKAKTTQAIINAALAVTSALTLPPPAGFIAAGLAAALAAVEIATINAQQFKHGGLVSPVMANGGLLSGPSHAGGGIPIEAEGGEFVINKRATEAFLPLLELINASTLSNRTPTDLNLQERFTTGGVVRGTALVNERGPDEQQMVRAYVVEKDISDAQSNNNRRSSFSEIGG